MIPHSELKLFRYGDNWVTCGDIQKALKDVEAADCDILFLHTELSFGVKNPEIKRKELCQILYSLFAELNVNTLVFPTFTFSYSNREDFDVVNSPSKMGMLNEYVRSLPEARRSLDPMMSVVVIGKNKALLNVTGSNSIGNGSIFDNLHNTPNVKFLFFGTKLGNCGTHMHYVEEQLNVPYRYNMDFYGKMIDYEGNITDEHRVLFVKYRDVLPSVPQSFEDELIESNMMKYCKLGKTGIYTISEDDMYSSIYKHLADNVNAFLAEPYDTHPLVKEYSYGNVTTVQ